MCLKVSDDIDSVKKSACYSAVKMSLSMQKIWGSIPRPVKSDTLQPMARHSCDVSSELRGPGPKSRAAMAEAFLKWGGPKPMPTFFYLQPGPAVA